MEKQGGTGSNGGDNGAGSNAGDDDQERRPSAPGARGSGRRGARGGAKSGGRGERRGDTLRFVLREGRNRQIRKMLSALGWVCAREFGACRGHVLVLGVAVPCPCTYNHLHTVACTVARACMAVWVQETKWCREWCRAHALRRACVHAVFACSV